MISLSNPPVIIQRSVGIPTLFLYVPSCVLYVVKNHIHVVFSATGRRFPGNSGISCHPR